MSKTTVQHPDVFWDRAVSELEKFQDTSDPAPIFELIETSALHDPFRAQSLTLLFIGLRLGYSNLFARWSFIQRRLLWRILGGAHSSELDDACLGALYRLSFARSNNPRFLPHCSALAALIVWKHRPDWRNALQASAFGERSLPLDFPWLRDIARRFPWQLKNGDAQLQRLIRTEIDGRHHTAAAKLAGAKLAVEHGNLFKQLDLATACRTASEVQPFRDRVWLELMVEAALAGDLEYEWLEQPVRACIRLTSDPKRAKHLRAYEARTGFGGGHRHLYYMYEGTLRSLQADARSHALARQTLFEKIQSLRDQNPLRAQKLLELEFVFLVNTRKPTWEDSIATALEQLHGTNSDKLQRWLAALYIKNLTIQPYAVRFVLHQLRRYSPPQLGLERKHVDQYLTASNYRRAFKNMRFDYRGTQIRFEDRSASQKINFYLTSRRHANLFNQLALAFSPANHWVETALQRRPSPRKGDLVAEAVSQTVHGEEIEDGIVQMYQHHDAPVTDMSHITSLGLDQIDPVAYEFENRWIIAGFFAGTGLGAVYAVGDPADNSVVPISLFSHFLDAFFESYPKYYGLDISPSAFRKRCLQLVFEGSERRLAPPSRADKLLVDYLETLRVAVELTNLWAPTYYRIPISATTGGLYLAHLVFDICEVANTLASDQFLAHRYTDWNAVFPLTPNL